MSVHETIIDQFLAERGQFDFKNFLNLNELAKELIQQVVDDFKLFENAGDDLSTKMT